MFWLDKPEFCLKQHWRVLTTPISFSNSFCHTSSNQCNVENSCWQSNPNFVSAKWWRIRMENPYLHGNFASNSLMNWDHHKSFASSLKRSSVCRKMPYHAPSLVVTFRILKLNKNNVKKECFTYKIFFNDVIIIYI